jgi:hypothetical protein
MTPVLRLAAHLTIQGQIIVPDFGFYARDCHASLIRENRLIAGVYTLSELNSKLRQMCLLMEKGGSSVRYDGRGGLGDVRRPHPGHQRVWCVRTKADVSLTVDYCEPRATFRPCHCCCVQEQR